MAGPQLCCNLDSIIIAVKIHTMRTTVTIDPDTEALIREEVARTGASFKVVLNESIRRALGKPSEKVAVKPLFNVPFPPSLGENPNFKHLATEWDDDATMNELTS